MQLCIRQHCTNDRTLRIELARSLLFDFRSCISLNCQADFAIFGYDSSQAPSCKIRSSLQMSYVVTFKDWTELRRKQQLLLVCYLRPQAGKLKRKLLPTNTRTSKSFFDCFGKILSWCSRSALWDLTRMTCCLTCLKLIEHRQPLSTKDKHN